jgi:hypothetical protein
VAGFYQQNQQQNTDDDNEVLAVPIHSSGEGIPDPLLRPTDFHCPKYTERVGLIWKKLEADLRVKYSDLADFAHAILRVEPHKNVTVGQLAKLSNINREVFSFFCEFFFILYSFFLFIIFLFNIFIIF